MSNIDKFKRTLIGQTQKGNLVGKITDFLNEGEEGKPQLTEITLQNGVVITRRRLQWHELGQIYHERQTPTGRGAIPF
jgi:hypothetical protein